ncbi:MAG: UpxY family transcription antiterminator [Bacteroidaceae bacterium]|nr:UpxY family transcription antiterminator [Bacteroidaceae bacterium]
MSNKQTIKWFVLKAGRREKAAQSALHEAGINHYLPTHQVAEERCGQKRLVERPLISNMLFAQGTHDRINSFVRQHDYIHFAYRREGAGFSILEVPDAELEAFRGAVTSMAGDLTYYHPNEIPLRQGTKVRIVGGNLDGYEGIVLRDKKEAAEMFYIDFPLLGALGTHVAPDYIQIIPE